MKIIDMQSYLFLIGFGIWLLFYAVKIRFGDGNHKKQFTCGKLNIAN